MSAEYACRAPRTASPRLTAQATAMAIMPTQNTMMLPSRANSALSISVLEIPLPTPAVSATRADAATSLRYRCCTGPFPRPSPAPDMVEGNGSAEPMERSRPDTKGSAAM